MIYLSPIAKFVLEAFSLPAELQPKIRWIDHTDEFSSYNPYFNEIRLSLDPYEHWIGRSAPCGHAKLNEARSFDPWPAPLCRGRSDVFVRVLAHEMQHAVQYLGGRLLDFPIGPDTRYADLIRINLPLEHECETVAERVLSRWRNADRSLTKLSPTSGRVS